MSDVENATAAIDSLNAVEGFRPEIYLMEDLDPLTGETRLRLPVLAQVAWFRLKYPQGRIAVDISEADAKVMARARVDHQYDDPPECFLSEAVGCCRQHNASPQEQAYWEAQNDAVGQALLRAGFGLQFLIEPKERPDGEADMPTPTTTAAPPTKKAAASAPAAPKAPPAPPTPAQATISQPEENMLEQAMKLPCPISKYQGKTLGDMIVADPKALTWIATKFTGDEKIAAGARLICEQARQATA